MTDQPKSDSGIDGTRGNTGRSIPMRIARALLLYVLPLCVIVGGVIGAAILIKTAPKAKRRPPQKQSTMVRVQSLERTSMHTRIEVMGTVVAAREVMLQPQVSGEIVRLSPHFIPGGAFKAGDFMMQIEPRDYELAVEQAKSQVAQAEYESKLEQGHQEIAQREWDILDMKEQASELDRELALRRPQLLKAEASLKAAQAALKDAQLDLERTTIVAPFNCMVRAENVDLGTQVTPQTQLGTLVGIDEYWVQAAVPVDQLRWIRFPDIEGRGGAKAIIRQELGTGTQGQWEGQVVRLLSDLEPQGRMARVLISVPDPLHLDYSNGRQIPLLIDAYVNVQIEGLTVENIISLPRSALRDNDTVWVAVGNGKDERLEIRSVDILWSNRDTVFVKGGLEDGDKMVVSDLPAPVQGMSLTTTRPAGSEPTTTQADKIDN